MQRVPWQIIQPLISTLKGSVKSYLKDKAEKLVKILTSIRKNTVLSSPNRENIVIRPNRRALVYSDDFDMDHHFEYKSIYRFKHPGIGPCVRPGDCGFIIRYFVDYKGRINTAELVMDSDYYPGTGVHYHDIISERDMCVYRAKSHDLVESVIHPNGWAWDWWEDWFRYEEALAWNIGLIDEGVCVAYNVSDYMIAK